MINRSLSEPIEENNSSKPYSGRHVIFCEGKTDSIKSNVYIF